MWWHGMAWRDTATGCARREKEWEGDDGSELRCRVQLAWAAGNAGVAHAWGDAPRPGCGQKHPRASTGQEGGRGLGWDCGDQTGWPGVLVLPKALGRQGCPCPFVEEEPVADTRCSVPSAGVCRRHPSELSRAAAELP